MQRIHRGSIVLQSFGFQHYDRVLIPTCMYIDEQNVTCGQLTAAQVDKINLN